MSEATQQGASVHDRLVALLGGDEAQETNQPEQNHIPEQENDDEPEQSAPEPQDEAEDEDTKDAQEDEGPRIELSDVAKYLGVDADILDVDENGEISIKTKVDGTEGRAKLKDLHKSYQLEGHLNKQNMEVAEQRKTLQAKMDEVEQQAQQRFQQAEDLMGLAQNELYREFNAINWQELRAVDPAEYAAKLADFQARQAGITQNLNYIQQERQQSAAKNQQAMQSRLVDEEQKLLAAIPEWSNSEARAKDDAALREYGKKVGFSERELTSVADHRAVVLLRKAFLYDQLMSKKPDVEKKVKAAPKLAKPAMPSSKQERSAADMKQLKKTIQKSNGKSGIAEYLMRTGKV